MFDIVVYFNRKRETETFTQSSITINREEKSVTIRTRHMEHIFMLEDIERIELIVN